MTASSTSASRVIPTPFRTWTSSPTACAGRWTNWPKGVRELKHARRELRHARCNCRCAYGLPRDEAKNRQLLAGCLLPRIVYVAWSLPSRSASSSWDVAWAGFDAGLFAALAATGWAAWRHAWWVQVAAIATATLLVVDVWFDVVTASGGALAVAVVEAVVA